MSFPFTTLIALFTYFMSRAVLKTSRQVYIGLFLALILILGLMTFTEGVSLLAAHLSATSKYKTLIAAADTFRAAAVEQLSVWGDCTLGSGYDHLPKAGDRQFADRTHE